jgi:hypothetical protein
LLGSRVLISVLRRTYRRERMDQRLVPIDISVGKIRVKVFDRYPEPASGNQPVFFGGNLLSSGKLN